MPDRFWVPLDRDVLRVDGPEAESYLQGQLSQDVAAIPAGGHAWSWLLAPNGKVDALLRVGRAAGDRWLLDTDGGWGERVAVRLERFKLRTKAHIEPVPATVIGLRGDGWATEGFEGFDADLVASPPWPGVAGVDLIFLDSAPELPEAAKRAPGDYEPDRIAAGIPRMGAELDDKTIPAETGLVPLTVSFTKGCYTGQELVARIDSRGGHVPKTLRSLRLGGPAEPGTELVDGEKSAGVVTSSAYSDQLGWVALGYVKRGYEPPVRLLAGAGGPTAEVA